MGQLVDGGDGSVVGHYEYDPFGKLTESYGAAADGNAFRFSTKYFDGETGLVYYGYRYYLPELGRWISRDPIEESGGYNLYVFVLNNPLIFMDPLGQKGLAEYIYDIHVFFQKQWDYHSGQTDKTLHNNDLPSYLYHASSALFSGILALAIPDDNAGMFLALITVDMGPALAEGAAYLGRKIVYLKQCGNKITKIESPDIPAELMKEAARLEKQWAKEIQSLIDSNEILAVDKSSIGKAVVRQYENGYPEGHFTIEIKNGASGLHTEQVIIKEDLSATTIIKTSTGNPATTKTIDISDAENAMNYQKSLINKELGAYDVYKNSCLSHVIDVLEKGGEKSISKTKLGYAKFLRKNGFNLLK